jgi:beta-phosphoglucomutase
MSNIEAVLLDMNGVLVNDEQLHEEAFARTLEPNGLSLSPDDYKLYFAGRTDKEGFESYIASKGKNISIGDLLTAKSEQYMQLSKEGVEGYEGIREFVEDAVSRGVKVAVVTSASKGEASSLLEGLGIAPFLAVTVTAEEVEEGKPSPEGYLKAAQQLDVDPRDV